MKITIALLFSIIITFFSTPIIAVIAAMEFHNALQYLVILTIFLGSAYLISISENIRKAFGRSLLILGATLFLLPFWSLIIFVVTLGQDNVKLFGSVEIHAGTFVKTIIMIASFMFGIFFGIVSMIAGLNFNKNKGLPSYDG